MFRHLGTMQEFDGRTDNRVTQLLTLTIGGSNLHVTASAFQRIAINVQKIASLQVKSNAYLWHGRHNNTT